jgi:flavin-dependent dehydrogenase
MAIESKKDFAELPSGSIIATGMLKNSFIALDVPFVPAYAYFSVREFKKHQGPKTIVYLDKYTKDYGYFTIINGIGATILFQRGASISAAAREWFPRRLKEDEGLDFTDWQSIEDYVGTPTSSFFNPRLFHDRFILTGTLAGVQDPSWVIGVHGALVSGKIAAMAVQDRDKALQEFRRMNRWWRLCYLGKKFFNATHPYSLSLIYKPIIKSRARFHQRYLWFLYPAIPGLRRI